MKKFLLFFVAVLTAIASHAEYKKTTVDGISYFYDTNTRSAVVIKPLDGKNYEGTVVVPGNFSVDGKYYIVTGLADTPFSGCRFLSRLSLPSHVKVDNLSSSEFTDCEMLQRVAFHDTEATKLPSKLFADCVQLSELYLASEKRVSYGQDVFNEHIINVSSANKRRVYLSRKSFTVTDVPARSFQATGDFEVYYAEEIDNLWYVGRYGSRTVNLHPTFRSEYEVKNLKLGGTLKGSDGTFSIAGVDTHSFRGNDTLEEVCVATDYLSINTTAFQGCPLLKSIILMNSNCTLARNAFSSMNPDFKIYVPESMVGTYKADSRHGWDNYADNIEPYIVETTVNSVTYNAYPFDGKCSITELSSSFYSQKLEPSNIDVDVYGNTFTCKLTAIDDYACYRNSTSIKEVDLSGCTNLKTIGMYAFRGASNLETLRLPSTIEYIDEGAFTANAGNPLPIKDIYCYSSTPCNINEYAFTYDAILHVPTEAAVKAYKAHPVWGKFSQVVCAEVESCGLSFMGVEITTANCDDVLGDGRVRYNAKTGWLFIKSGYYQSNSSIISVDKELLEIVVKQDDSEGAVIFDCTSSDPAIVTNVKAFIMFTGIDAMIYYNGNEGIKGSEGILYFYDKSHVWLLGRNDNCKPICGFLRIALSNTEIKKPFNGRYDMVKRCMMVGDTEYSGEVEIGAPDNSAKLPIWIMGKQVTEEMATDIMGDGKASYKDGTLYLNGVNWTSNSSNIIESTEELHIEISGVNHLTSLDAAHNCIKAPGIIIYKADKAKVDSLIVESRGEGETGFEAIPILSTNGQDAYITNTNVKASTKAGLFGIGATSSESILWLESAYINAQGAWSAIGGFGGLEKYGCSTIFTSTVYGQPKNDSGYCFINNGTGKPETYVIILPDDMVPPCWATTEGAYEVSNITANSAHISWDEATDNIPLGIKYTIFYKEADTDGIANTLDMGAEREVELTDLYPNTTYIFSIKATDLWGNDSSNNLEGFFTTAEDDSDGITGIAVNGAEAKAIYNLAGQRMQKAQKGLNIIGGKKVMVK